jgi:hypothetical protein
MLSLSVAFAVVALVSAQAPDARFSFFITSVGKGDGANLGGLAGADQHCASLAASVNAPARTWRAYLSSTGPPVVNARQRIGSGPWFNIRGIKVADNVTHLHMNNGTNNSLGQNVTLDEKGGTVRLSGPNTHDILTGSTRGGDLASTNPDLGTCRDWTSNVNNNSSLARVGHSNKAGGGQFPTSWNSAHDSRGCSQALLAASGGAGLFYCFATSSVPVTTTATAATTTRTMTTATAATTAATTTRASTTEASTAPGTTATATSSSASGAGTSEAGTVTATSGSSSSTVLSASGDSSGSSSLMLTAAALAGLVAFL